MVPDIAPPRGRTYLVDTNGESTRRIARTPIIGKDSEVACSAQDSPAFGSSGLSAAQHPKQGARLGAARDRSVTRFRICVSKFGTITHQVLQQFRR